MRPKISQATLQTLFAYAPETGVLTRKTQPNNRVRIGAEAGYLRPDGYRCVEIRNVPYRTHRIIWCMVTGEWLEEEIDHVNHIGDDNRWGNLREVTHRENGKNHAKHKNNTSEITGVSWLKTLQKWEAYIGVDGKKVYLGLFENKKNAILARCAANTKYGFHSNHGAERETK